MLKSVPGVLKQATLGPILEPFPVSGLGKKVDPCVARINVRENTHTHTLTQTHTRFWDDTPHLENSGSRQCSAVSELLVVSISCNISQEDNGLNIIIFNSSGHSKAWAKTRRL